MRNLEVLPLYFIAYAPSVLPAKIGLFVWPSKVLLLSWSGYQRRFLADYSLKSIEKLTRSQDHPLERAVGSC